MSERARPHLPGLTARRRAEGESVLPLELFFDLVFVLALTQCTALMAADPTWEGLIRSLLILGILWWSWVGYSWLTSVIDPDEGPVRLVIFAAMAAFLVASLCIPEAFDSRGLLFAGAYAVVRVAQIALFVIASRDDPGLRASVNGLAISTAVGVSLLAAASFTDGTLQGSLWAIALAIDAGGPYFFGAEGWRLSPTHFAERHALIVIIALGESIVVIGGGTEAGVDAGVVAAAVAGMALAAALWWLYFDVVALVAERRLSNAHERALEAEASGDEAAARAAARERNEIARDSFSYLHFPMIAGIVLIALGVKKTIGHVEDPLKLVPAAALFGGAALYLLAHVAFRWRNVHRFSSHRLLVAAACCALVPLATEITALAALALLTAILIGLIVYEFVRFKDLRERLRRDLRHP